MIDTCKKYWTGDCAADIDEWLRLYVPNETLDIKPVVCRACGGGGFLLPLCGAAFSHMGPTSFYQIVCRRGAK